MTMRSGTLPGPVSLAILVALGCGGPTASSGASAGSSAGDESASSGDEATARLGPLRSFVPESARVVSRIDMSRIRRSPVGPDIAGAIQASRSYQDWARGSGLDPVADLDAILLAGDALYSDRRVIVLRTTGDEARARDLVLRIALAHDATPTWREEGGFAVATYPDPALRVPHVVVLTAAHEVVIAPEDDLSRVLEVARDHAARRSTGDEVVEPQFSFAEGEVMALRSDEPPPSREGYPTPPERYRLDVVEDAASGRTLVHLFGSFAAEADAAAAHEWLEVQARTFADHMLVRMAQLDRPLTEARIRHAGTELEASTDFTTDELRRALGAVALFQASADSAM